MSTSNIETRLKTWSYVAYAAGNQVRGYCEIICDSEDAIGELPVDDTIAPGSIATIIATGSKYVLNNNHEWVQQGDGSGEQYDGSVWTETQILNESSIQFVAEQGYFNSFTAEISESLNLVPDTFLIFDITGDLSYSGRSATSFDGDNIVLINGQYDGVTIYAGYASNTLFIRIGTSSEEPADPPVINLSISTLTDGTEGNNVNDGNNDNNNDVK